MDSAPILGSGEYRYRYVREWAHLPRFWTFGDDDPSLSPPRSAMQGVCTAEGDTYVVCRGAHPVLVFDADGGFVSSWGEGRFTPWMHGISVARDGSLWIVDTATHAATRHAPDGALLQTLGRPGMPAPTWYGGPFNMPTGVAEAPDGTLYVSDGYGNRRVHRFAPDGTLLHSWGEAGDGPGQFALVHFLAVGRDGTLYVCDRENDRVQLFDTDGHFLSQWVGFQRPSDIALGRDAAYVGGADGVTILDYDGTRRAQFGDGLKIHGIWLDAAENIFLAQFDRAVSRLERLSA
jgi:DNA-binding beta-propeller fold protein YncE